MNVDVTKDSKAVWRISADETGPCPAELRERLVAGIPGVIPGAVHQALLASGLIADPFFGKNADSLEWIEQVRWILELELEFSVGSGPVDLILDGVDTYATVSLNETEIGTTDNAFRKFTFPATDAAVDGVNRLQIQFRTIKDAVGPDAKKYNCAFYNTDRVHVRRMQCTFGWDWVHNFVTFGLTYAPVLTDRPVVAFPGVLTAEVKAGLASVEARWDVSELRKEAACDVEVTVFSPSGEVLATQVVPIGEGRALFEIAEPELWNPAGYGAQTLYRASFLPVRDGVAVGDEVSVPFGIRVVEFLNSFDEEGSEAEAMTLELSKHVEFEHVRGREFGFRVNGVDVFAMGGNWVPCDPFPGAEVEARKKRILREFAQCGGNAIRIWGGGTYETPGFYETCAELGIIVLQDFMMACADYPSDDAVFMANLAIEIDQVVLRLRGYSALVHWYGDNENAMFDGEVAPGRAWYDIFENVSRPAIERHDLGRSATASCPFFGTTSFNPLQGDSHMSIFFTEDRAFLLSEMLDYKERIEQLVGRFGSEYALYGAPDVESLVKFMPPDQLDETEMWEYHTKDNPSRPPGVTITLFGGLEASARNILGAFEDSQDRLNKMAYVHYEAVRMAVEASRRKQPFCRGVLFWMLNDCWPASGWSLIDYYARPKAAAYGFKHAAQPVHCSFRPVGEKAEAWVSNNSLTAVKRTFTVAFEAWDGTRNVLGAVEAEVAAGTSKLLLAIDPSAVSAVHGGIFVAESEAGDCGWFFDGMPSAMNPPAATLTVESVRDADGSILCRVAADTFAKVVTLRGAAVADENYFHLRAGETRTIRLRFPEGEKETALTLKAWNSAAVTVI